MFAGQDAGTGICDAAMNQPNVAACYQTGQNKSQAPTKDSASSGSFMMSVKIKTRCSAMKRNREGLDEVGVYIVEHLKDCL